MNTEFYDNAIHFAYYQIKKLGCNSGVDKYDVVHDVIASPNFNETDWKKQIMDRIINQSYGTKINHFNIDKAIPKKENETRFCECCKDSYPDDLFISGYDKRKGCFNYRKPCRECYNKTVRKSSYYKKQRNMAFSQWATDNYGSLAEFGKARRELNKVNGIKDTTANERNKRFVKKQTEELGDWYIKRLLTRHKKIDVTAEMIEEKRQQVLKMRKERNWRTIKIKI